MRAHEFITPEEQLQLLTQITQNTRAEIEYERQAHRLSQHEAVGDMPMDFLKRLLDVAWSDLDVWLVLQGDEPTSQKSAGAVGNSPARLNTNPIKKTPVARFNTPKPSRSIKPKRVKQPKRAKQSERVNPVNIKKTPKVDSKQDKLPTPPEPDSAPSSQVTPLKPDSTPVNQVTPLKPDSTPVNQVTSLKTNTKQLKPQIKPYRTLSMLK